MSKAVLIKEMPETCCDCMFVRELDEGIDACCGLCLDPEESTLLRMIDGYCHGRPDWCPWQEITDVQIDKENIQKAIDHYGKETQTTVCMEECAELIQAISKEKRGKSNLNHIAEEMADVLICIEMLKQIYNIPDKLIQTWIKNKQKREVERINAD